MNMKNKYILSVHPKSHNQNHAGSKAVLDIELYANEIGFKKVDICNKLNNKYISLKDILINQINVKNNSIILFQYPSIHGKMDNIISKIYIQNKKNSTTIAIIHDLECLRFLKSNGSRENINKELKILNRFDYVISHNSIMSNWLIENGLKSKIIDLELFDYKTELKIKKFNRSKFKEIAFAGNLDKDKSGFIYKLDKLKSKNLNINLYGPNYENQENSYKNLNIKYKGTYSPEKLPEVLEEGFGLIWDGRDLDTCSGQTGDYTKYNNPHKLSLYLSAGLPVIVWREAAISKIVEEYNLGIVIDSIYDIEQKLNLIEEYDYLCMLSNVREIQPKVINGFFIKNAISKIEKDIKLY